MAYEPRKNKNIWMQGITIRLPYTPSLLWWEQVSVTTHDFTTRGLLKHIMLNEHGLNLLELSNKINTFSPKGFYSKVHHRNTKIIYIPHNGKIIWWVRWSLELTLAIGGRLKLQGLQGKQHSWTPILLWIKLPRSPVFFPHKSLFVLN